MSEIPNKKWKKKKKLDINKSNYLIKKKKKKRNTLFLGTTVSWDSQRWLFYFPGCLPLQSLPSHLQLAFGDPCSHPATIPRNGGRVSNHGVDPPFLFPLDLQCP
jgi:hypothetical protein